jgi:predicted DNA repair protein MutK
MVKGAVRTDFILSAEIMAIALERSRPRQLNLYRLQAAALVTRRHRHHNCGLWRRWLHREDGRYRPAHGAARKWRDTRPLAARWCKGMPKLIDFLSMVGTAAMLWVGGQIIVHGFGLHPAEWFGLHEGALAWMVDAGLSGVAGLAIGAVIVGVHHLWAHAEKSA